MPGPTCRHHRLLAPCLFLGLSLAATSLPCFAHTTVDPSLLGELTALAEESTPEAADLHFISEGDLSFLIKPDKLAQGQMQISSKLLSRTEFLASPYAAWDIDKLANAVADDDLIMVSRSAALIPGKTPTFFSLEQIIDPAYLTAAFYDTENEVSPAKAKVTCTRSYHGFPIRTQIHFETYDHKNGVSQHMTGEEKDKILDNAPLHDDLEMITSTYSRKSDVSLGSYGGRTVNYYYAIGDSASLHISHKLVTFKKEIAYSVFPVSMMNIWDKINETATQEQQQGSWENVKSIRAFKGKIKTQSKA